MNYPLKMTFLFFFALMGCSNSINIEEIGTKELRNEAVTLLDQYSEVTFSNIDLSRSPAIKALNFEKIYILEDGLYIKLNNSFTEKGIHIPRSGIKVNTEQGLDPSYTEIKDGVYQYEIKG